MKPAPILFLFLTALILLLGLQAIWLVHTYRISLEATKEFVNSSCFTALEKELEERLIKYNKLSGEQTEGEQFEDMEIQFEADQSQMKEKGVRFEVFSMTQLALNYSDVRLNLRAVDSIFHEMLLKEGINTSSRLLYCDSLNNIIEASGPEIKDGFATDWTPIISGNKVRAIVKISPAVIFRDMGGILAISALIILIIAISLVYVGNLILTQQHLNRLRENFTYALTHDMKTPLGTVYSVLQQSESGHLDANPELRSRFMSVAIEQTLNMQAIINQILTVAYLDKKKLALKRVMIELPAMIDSLVNKFKVQKRKEISFTTRYDLNDTIIYADPLYLSNAISNLIDNAIKYSGEPVQIDITCSAGEKQVLIRVRDNGFGISEAEQEKIFERFERGGEFKRNKVSGFGLGLSYVRAVIQAHGGTVAVISKKGLGSEFTVTLPIVLTHIAE